MKRFALTLVAASVLLFDVEGVQERVSLRGAITAAERQTLNRIAALWGKQDVQEKATSLDKSKMARYINIGQTKTYSELSRKKARKDAMELLKEIRDRTPEPRRTPEPPSKKQKVNEVTFPSVPKTAPVFPSVPKTAPIFNNPKVEISLQQAGKFVSTHTQTVKEARRMLAKRPNSPNAESWKTFIAHYDKCLQIVNENKRALEAQQQMLKFPSVPKTPPTYPRLSNQPLRLDRTKQTKRELDAWTRKVNELEKRGNEKAAELEEQNRRRNQYINEQGANQEKKLDALYKATTGYRPTIDGDYVDNNKLHELAYGAPRVRGG